MRSTASRASRGRRPAPRRAGCDPTGNIVAFLNDAGCAAERLHLPDHGVRGNGHGIMLERNNREALGAILAWLDVNVADLSPPTEEE